jgi:DNA-binding response OmpR family regulator/KaiC/GvpD/RAD55 family RecA-like ATPase
VKLERWGVKVIDSQLKGLESGRRYMIYGPEAFDLQCFLLTFLATGLKLKEKCALVTSEEPGEVIRIAKHLGFDIEKDIIKENLSILRTKPFFGEKLVQLRSPDRVIQELRNLLGSPGPQRIAFFPLSSFVSDSSPDHLMKSTELFVTALRNIRATTMIGEQVRSNAQDLYLLQEIHRAVDGVFRLTSTSDDTHEVLMEKDFTPEGRRHNWVYFIQKGSGIQAVEGEASLGQGGPDGSESQDPSQLRRVLLVSDDVSETEKLKEGLEPIYKIEMARSETEAMTQLLQPRYGLILVCFTDDDRGESFCRYVRTQRIKLPLVLVGNAKRRAWERASVLLQGVDDFIARPYSQVELISRISSILRRASFGFPFDEVAEYIGAQKRLWQKLQKVDKEDATTGLVSFKFFSAALEHELFKAKMVGYPCSILSLLFEGGDVMREEFEALMKNLIRDTDILTLLPSGVYLVFLGASGPVEVERFLDRLSKAMLENPKLNGAAIRYGVANYPKDSLEGDGLMNLVSSRVQDAPSTLKL